jgi:HlyD family secretion protein
MDYTLDEKTIRSRRIRRWGIVSAVVFVLFLLLGFSISRLSPSISLNKVRVETVSRGSVEAVVSGTGLVIPIHESVITCPFETRLTRLIAEPGDTLEVGNDILQLDTEEITFAHSKVLDEIELKRNQLQQIDIQSNREIERLASEKEELGLRLNYLEAVTKHEQELFSLQATTPWAVRQAELDEQIARLTYERQTGILARTREAIEAEKEGVIIELNLLQTQRAEIEYQLQQAQVIASEPGVLIWVYDELGGSVRKGEPLARIADLDEHSVEASISDIHVNRLRPGQRVRLTTYNDTLSGSIQSIPPNIERGTVQLRIRLDNPGTEKLHTNQRVDVHVIHDHRDNSLLIPKGPYTTGSGQLMVFVIEGDQAVRRVVTLGLAGIDHYEVLDGLAEGERVIVSDLRDRQHLQTIRVR